MCSKDMELKKRGRRVQQFAPNPSCTILYLVTLAVSYCFLNAQVTLAQPSTAIEEIDSQIQTQSLGEDDTIVTEDRLDTQESSDVGDVDFQTDESQDEDASIVLEDHLDAKESRKSANGGDLGAQSDQFTSESIAEASESIVAQSILLNEAILLFQPGSAIELEALSELDLKISVSPDHGQELETHGQEDGQEREIILSQPQPKETRERVQEQIEDQIDQGIESTDLEPPLDLELELPESESEVEEETVDGEDVEPEIDPEVAKQQALEIYMLNALDASAERYPWLVNTTDKLIINPHDYRASRGNLNFEVDLNINSRAVVDGQEFDNSFLEDASFSFSPKGQQFYWILDRNRVVIETQGLHGNFRPQGQLAKEERFTQFAVVAQSFFGVQAVWAVPRFLPELQGQEDLKVASVATAAVEVVNPAGAPIGGLTIDMGLDPNDPQVVILDDLDKGETFSVTGGGAVFDNLDADNAPLFLQGFPTVNLQPLLNNGVELRVGEVIPAENLAAANMNLGEFLTGQGGGFDFQFSSVPGLKILRLGESDNDDIVRLLANPFLSPEQRDFHYLNSLLWVSLPQQDPQLALVDNQNLLNSDTNLNESNWLRFTTSLSRNRTVIEYDQEEAKATYHNLFSNPGLSVTLANLADEDSQQSLTSTLGLMAGGVLFRFLNGNGINGTLQEAKEEYEGLQPLLGLDTEATQEERRAMNIRLNRTLAHADLTTNLRQVSGSWSFFGLTKPQNSLVLQLRSGLHRRGVSFLEQDVEEFGDETIFFSRVRRSNEDFGPLEFRGERFPIESTNIGANPTNQAIASQTVVRLPDGTALVTPVSTIQRPSTTTVPVPDLNISDITFDVLEFSRIRSRNINISTYSGYVYLPAIELLASGSQGPFNYGVSIGGWLNPTPDQAPGIDNNVAEDNGNSLTSEPHQGGYVRGALRWLHQDILHNEEGRVSSIMTHAPFFNFSWNTSANRLNQASAALGYQFAYRDRGVNMSFAPVLVYAPERLDVVSNLEQNLDERELSIFWDARVSTTNGWNFGANLELGEDNYYELDGMYRLFNSQRWGQFDLGAYYSNFQTLNRGLTSRISDRRYGVSIQYQPPTEQFQILAQLGDSRAGFEVDLSLKANINF